MRKTIILGSLLAVLAAAQPFVGDTIGGTTYDWGFGGPSWRTIAWDSLYGIHVMWLYSASNQSTFPDRNNRYNFYDISTGQWTFNQGASFMEYGINCFPDRSGFGALDVNPVTHCAYVSAHQGYIYPLVAREIAPGSGTFEECTGEGGPADQYLWPNMSLTPDQRVHVAMMDNDTRNAVFYSAVNPWCTWSVPVHISPTDPNFMSQYIEASKARTCNVGISWINVDAVPYRFYYRISTNSGRDWGPQIQLDPPPAFTPGSETIPSFHLAGNCLMWDNDDRLHIAVSVMPCIRNTGYVIPAEIWHYSPDNTPVWNRITRATCDTANLQGRPGYNAIYACRPMLAVDDLGNLLSTWEQFDSMNVEPSTNCLRADIFTAYSPDNGRTWSAPVRATTSDNTSHRYPSLSRSTEDGGIHVVYLQDLIAGAFVQGEGNASLNPVIYLTGPVAPSEVAEPPAALGTGLVLTAAPNPFYGRTRIRLQLGRSEPVRLCISDASGRTVAVMADRVLGPGTHTFDWQPYPAAEGIYFLRLDRKRDSRTLKLILTR